MFLYKWIGCWPRSTKWLCVLFLWKRGFFRGAFLLRASSGQDPRHRVIAFMARVFKQRVRRALHGELDRPALHIHGRVHNGGTIGKSVGTRACQAFDDTQVLVAHPVILNPKAALVARTKIGGFNYQSFALPVAHRIAGPLPDDLRQARLTHWSFH